MIEEALVEALTPPDHYYGAITDLVRQGWAQVAGMHRDSDVLSLSNWEYMLDHYGKKYEVNDDFRVEGSSHWLVGWNDELLVRALQCECEDWEQADFSLTTFPLDNETTSKGWYCWTCETEATVREVFEDALDFAERLRNYPVLDEEDFSNREHEELMEHLELLVHEEDVEELASYLFDVHSVSRADDLTDQMIEDWKKQRLLNWRVTVFDPGMREVGSWTIEETSEPDADDQAWKQVHADFPDHYDWRIEEIE